MEHTRVKPTPPSDFRKISFTVQVGDVTTFDADVIALKFAQALFGADKAVARALGKNEDEIMELLPTSGA